MTIDPGLGGTGWAEWDSFKRHPLQTGVIHCKEDLSWLERGHHITWDLGILLQLNPKVKDVHVEYPCLMMTAAGMASAQRGDMLKLMFLVGCFAQKCWELDREFHPLEVNKWKGSMSKAAVASRVATRLGCEPDDFPNHTMDAVGMGIFLKGLMNESGTIRVKRKSS